MITNNISVNNKNNMNNKIVLIHLIVFFVIPNNKTSAAQTERQ